VSERSVSPCRVSFASQPPPHHHHHHHHHHHANARLPPQSAECSSPFFSIRLYSFSVPAVADEKNESGPLTPGGGGGGTGPCHARHLAQALRRGEDYVLNVDSHMRFRPGWDEYLVRRLEGGTARPGMSVLTAYPPGYDPPDGPGPLAETRPTVLAPWRFDGDGVLRQRGRLLRAGPSRGRARRRCGDSRDGDGGGGDDDDYDDDEEDNIRCLLYAGGFNFSRSTILDLCPYDPGLHGLFFGEEISMAARLYTHGVDLYAPPQTVCYHLWNRDRPSRRRVGAEEVRGDGDDDAPTVGDDWARRTREDSLDVVRMQLRGSGRGLGTARSVAQFARELGVDFESQTLTAGCEDVGLGKDAFVSPSSSIGTTAATEEGGGDDRITGEEMNSILALVGRFMNET
jgi:hypothetical protein